jgi:hypothetical protein
MAGTLDPTPDTKRTIFEHSTLATNTASVPSNIAIRTVSSHLATISSAIPRPSAIRSNLPA